MRRTSHPAGTVHRIMVDSAVLKSNRLGDPTNRIVDVYVPHGHDGSGLPLLVDLVGYTAGGPAHTAWKNFGENVPERLDRLIGDGAMPPVVVAFPDCFTRLGGNQYVDSPVMGNWEQFLISEMLPAVETQFKCGGAGKRGVFGKSSGGFGALIHAMRHPDIWSAAASHSGDAGFDLLYLGGFPDVLRALAKTENSIEAWMNAFEAKPKLDGKDTMTLMFLAQAASFDPDPNPELATESLSNEAMDHQRRRHRRISMTEARQLSPPHGARSGTVDEGYFGVAAAAAACTNGARFRAGTRPTTRGCGGPAPRGA